MTTQQIIIYDMNTKQTSDGTDLEGNGLRILHPSKCKIQEELNDDYSLELEHPVDSNGDYEYIIENNIIKALGQYFRIYRVVTDYDGAGGSITAYAQHIFYDLNSWYIQNLPYSGAGTDLVQIFSEHFLNPSDTECSASTIRRPSGETASGYEYKFTASTDISTNVELSCRYMSMCNILMSNDGIISQLGGQLKRDNFSIEIAEPPNLSTDARQFDIRVGLNLQGITRDIDYTDFCTYVVGYATDDNGSRHDKTSEAYDFTAFSPKHVVHCEEFSVEVGVDASSSSYSTQFKTALQVATTQYLRQHQTPSITYSIDVADLRRNPDYSDITNLPEFNVGDIGRVYDDRLGLNIVMQITKREVDALTGAVESVEFRNSANITSRTATPSVNTVPDMADLIEELMAGQYLIDSNGLEVLTNNGLKIAMKDKE